VLGYYSWGSLDPQLLTRQAGVRFVPGALAATYVGTSARTLTAPPPDWMPSQSADRATWFAGMPHGLVGDLIREGATGAAGYVWEPYMQGAVRADILFPAYLAGFNLIEAFYLATPVLSWQTVIIGDPLCAPFDREPIGRTDIDGGADGVTELPVFFSARRGQVLRRSLDATPEVIRLILRSESRFLHGDIAGGRQALEEASLGAPTVTALHRQLASLAEQAGDVDAALARYRRIVDLEPDDARALNNLAYGLAVHKNAPAEARPLAQRAVAVARDNPAMLDTLGWIEYLLGNYAEAVRLLTDAVKRAPSSAEIRLHTAHALVATGDLASARVQLDVALQLNPSLAGRADVRQLRDGLD
jgi:Flp pilus assembly protein TadD